MGEHEYYQQLMSRVLDESLTDEEQTALREHMRVCPECRRLGAAFTGMTAALREDLTEPPADLARGVMERIRDEAQAAPHRGGKDRTARRRRPWIRLGAAACLVLVAAGVATVSLRGRAKSSLSDTASVRSADMAQAQTRSADAASDAGGQSTAAGDGEAASAQENVPMTISEPAEEEAAVRDGTSAESGAAPETPAPEPSQEPLPLEPLPVYDAARNRVGSIAPENIPAFQALITDEGWAEGEYEYMLKVEYRQKTYAFATDDSGGLVWWEEPSTQPLRSPGTFADLHALIAMDPPALPE